MDNFKCRAVVEVEMLSLMGNGVWDFPTCPSPQDVCNTYFVSLCACVTKLFTGRQFTDRVSVEGKADRDGTVD